MAHFNVQRQCLHTPIPVPLSPSDMESLTVPSVSRAGVNVQFSAPLSGSVNGFQGGQRLKPLQFYVKLGSIIYVIQRDQNCYSKVKAREKPAGPAQLHRAPPCHSPGCGQPGLPGQEPLRDSSSVPHPTRATSRSAPGKLPAAGWERVRIPRSGPPVGASLRELGTRGRKQLRRGSSHTASHQPTRPAAAFSRT